MEEFHESSVVLPLGKYHSTSTISLVPPPTGGGPGRRVSAILPPRTLRCAPAAGSVKKICLSEASEQSSASIPLSPQQLPRRKTRNCGCKCGRILCPNPAAGNGIR